MVKRYVNVSEILQVIKTILNRFNPVFCTVVETEVKGFMNWKSGNVSKIRKIARLSGWN